VPLSTDAQRTAERTMVEEYLAGPSAIHASPRLFVNLLVPDIFFLPPLLLPSPSCPPNPRPVVVQSVLLPQTVPDRLVSGEITVNKATYFVTPTRCAVGQVPLLARFRRSLYTRYPLTRHVACTGDPRRTSTFRV